ncbi:hypothetical protein KUL42_43740 [Alteromonas sp. KUL42]|jgi:effector-binding domain-containing protein|uniref:hypothetical protein n=1 Tax=Alteromonas sp. KUL42 TaxID=2480797 RepID=UPI001036ED0E|nr:hypothetical protein [Alteromonas sp. KUL42]TAP29998.1 hypothetical protein EYR97_21715 [Alteromonas sp. KUL42]GEA09613.1 hypothetical protein KUL42_43740 [Alteromonas sp. KUL42]|tara:strand:+ start:428 stop:1165 length:738 start_codon:yes stop_codon:yes gene_type:complete
MRTKAFHAFESKIHYFDDDIEFIDVMRLGIVADELTDDDSDYVLKNVDPDKHRHLSRRQNSEGSRKLIMTHLRTTVYSAYIKDVYEEVTDYLRTILEQAAEKGFEAGRLIGEHNFKIDAKDVLSAGNWEYVTKKIADSVFQALESERSTLKLLEKVANKLGLEVEKQLIENALPYLEVRHLLVHADGKASDEYKNKYPNIRLRGDKVFINYVFLTRMRAAIKAMMEAFDREVIAKDIVDAQHTQA